MTDSLVSVLIPVFDVGRYLEESLRSVLEQDHRPLEAIVVDDGSSDESAAVALAVAAEHPEIRVLRHPQNRGPAAARNTALADALGDLITFLDADDRMPPDRLSYQVAYLGDRPDVDIVFGRQEVVVEPGVALPVWLRQPPERQPTHYPMSLMARRELFDVVGEFDPELRVGSDADWLFRAAAANAQIEMADHLMVYRRVHGTNLTYRDADLRDSILRSLRGLVARRRAAP